MAEIIVTSTADSGAGSLRAAIENASDGDVILFDPAIFPAGQTTSIYLSSYIAVGKSLSIYGASDGQGGYTSGATKRYYVYRDVDGVKTKTYIDDDNPAQEGETVLFENICRVALDGQNAARCVRTASGTIVFSGIALINGHDTTGNGGGVYSSNLSVNTLNDCSISNCVAAQGGGGVYSSANSQNTLNDCSITNCSASSSGGGVCLTNSYQNTLNNCTFDGCSANNGGAIYSSSASQNTLNGCIFDGCSATSGGGVYSANTSQSTLNDCTITDCSATSGGGVCSASTSENTLNDCVISGCSATNGGGGVYSANTSQNTLNCCNITNCSAKSGGGVCSASTSENTLNGCTISGCTVTTYGDALYITGDSVINISNSTTLDDTSFVLSNSVANISGSSIESLTIGSSSGTAAATGNIDDITTVKNLTLTSHGAITIADGAALTITTSATIGAATFTSEGRGYLAVAPGINTSSATLTNVVLCAYGADVYSFAEVDGVLEWDADDPSVSVLLEREVNDAWTTLAQTTGESLDYYLPPKVNLRLFDGERFLTTATPDSRTYFYIGGAEGSFDDAEDWSLTKDGTAIPQSPTITDCAFVIQGAEGDVAISKGSANVTNATIIPAGTNDVSVVVDEATVLAGTERFTGTLTTTGDVTITGDASKLAIVVDGTLEVAGSLKLATLTLASGSSVVFASADDVLVVTDSATVNDATFSCEEPTAYFTAPVGTDLTQATFTNVYVATKGAEVVSVTGSRFGKNYSINIISEDNTLPVTVEYRLEGTNDWIVADPAFVGTTFQIRLDDEATFRVYNGETFTEATMKVYGLYNEMAAIVEIGYLI